jgi:fido (protein-threonine AMPylation protein)
MADMAGARQAADFAALRAALARFPGGASLEQITAAAALPISERTLIRRMAQMVEDGVVHKTGESRAARYVLATLEDTTGSVPPAPAQKDMFVPIGKAGGEILRLVTRPVHARKPVGYNRRLLSDYRPNRTSYLSAIDTARLKSISKTVDTADQRAGTYAQRILARLLIDLSWNSSRLEGNTYSLLDTQRLIEVGEPAEGKAATDAQMILNHKAAIEFLVQSAEDIAFNRYTILNLHALLAENLLPHPAAAGRIRQIPVTIGKSVYHPLDIPQVLDECFDEVLAKAQAIDDPFEQAFFIMVQLPYLQPFEDVNKRVSRLAANIPLFRRNLAPIAFVDVPDDTYTCGMLGVYELNRVDLLKDVFLWAYERSAARYAAIRQTTGDPDTFRLRHRQAVKQVVADVIREPMSPRQAARHIAAWANLHVPEADRPRFVEVAETELMAIHDGNFARYLIRPSEFQAWQAQWKEKPRRLGSASKPKIGPRRKR